MCHSRLILDFEFTQKPESKIHVQPRAGSRSNPEACPGPNQKFERAFRISVVIDIVLYHGIQIIRYELHLIA